MLVAGPDVAGRVTSCLARSSGIAIEKRARVRALRDLGRRSSTKDRLPPRAGWASSITSTRCGGCRCVRVGGFADYVQSRERGRIAICGPAGVRNAAAGLMDFKTAARAPRPWLGPPCGGRRAHGSFGQNRKLSGLLKPITRRNVMAKAHGI